MNHFRNTFIIFLILGLSTLSFAQHIKFSDAERTIIRLQDERRGIDTITRYLDSKEENVAWRAAIALANIADTTTRHTLILHLSKETRQDVIDGIAFALGVLGPDKEAAEALLEKATKYNHFSEACYVALGRTFPKEDIKDLSPILGMALGAKGKAGYSLSTPLGVSSALMEIGLRKLINEDCIGFLEALESDDDPVVRWHCAYALSRTEDSVLLSKHLDLIKLFLKDIGSPESRMFAATALGRVHNDEAGKILIEAARSETEWRVRVNIFNAIAKLPRFSSAIHEVLKKAVTESSKENLTGEHVARTALDVIDQMIAAGKVSSPDSVGIREWLTDYQPNYELHEEQSLRIRSQCMIPLARLGADEEKLRGICSFISYNDRTVEINVWKAVGLIPDTLAFYRMLQRVFSTPPYNVGYVLDGMHSLWEIAKKDTTLMKQLEESHYANLYRHMLIRFASLTDDPSVVSTTLEQIKDPLILKDSMRIEAEEYLLQYLDKFEYPKYHDHLISILSAIKWLKPKNDTFSIKLLDIRKKAASEWGDRALVDTINATINTINPTLDFKAITVKLIREPIDWKTLEQMPDTFLIPSRLGFMYVKPLTYYAPLTVLNIYKLAKINFFANCYFHRIVPNFVIQSGDITGTGDGGPGYSIRTEIAPIRYDSAGVVGMASSGKDTEGSQWFITECPTPHLNTRYTIWGEIVRGKEKIEKYQLNDQIENILPYK